jgi:hypothetical protein
LTDEEVRRALDHPAGPLFPTAAIRPFGKTVQFSPADERCIVGEMEIRHDSKERWSELSGEISPFVAASSLVCELSSRATADYR